MELFWQLYKLSCFLSTSLYIVAGMLVYIALHNLLL